MANLFVCEDFVDLTKDIRFSSTGVYETSYGLDELGDLYRACVREYGRCASSVRVDPTGRRVGWVFVKLDRYQDTGEPYLREVWVTVLSPSGRYRYLE